MNSKQINTKISEGEQKVLNLYDEMQKRGLHPAEIAVHAGISMTYAFNMLRQLEVRGLVKRVKSSRKVLWIKVADDTTVL
jgi:ribosomal protein S25